MTEGEAPPSAGGGNGRLQEEFVERCAERGVQLLQLGTQVLPGGLPGHAGHTATRRTHRLPSTPTSSPWSAVTSLSRMSATTSTARSAARVELRCPNTLFTGDFYRFRTRTVEVVRAMRALAVESGVEQPNWKRWVELTDKHRSEPVMNGTPVTQEHVADWAQGLGLPVGGETILFCDCEGAFFRPSVPRAATRILQAAGIEFGLMREQWCCGGPTAEMGYVDKARSFAEHNLADWRATGTKRVIAFDPHDYISFTEDYPRYFGDDYEIEVVLLVELVAELIEQGKLELDVPIDKTVTYHDACRLNKRKGIHAAPRKILQAIPGLTFKDIDHVTQWSYCSGAGGGLAIERPDLTAEISRRRVERAAELGVDTLVRTRASGPSGPCPSRADGRDEPVEVMDLMELVAAAAGLDDGDSA